MKAKHHAHEILTAIVEDLQVNNGQRKDKPWATKPYDVALTIMTDLKNAGLRIAWEPGRKQEG
ncbi:MAG: hypothetical protein ACYSW3_00060 [Planctomycetota bacterium]